ncbi:Vitamin B12 import ATP-binding protein BtuD [Serratia fonticola]|uniref:Vitamin B12 import ATP-binding protein BtuD n=1 Tax=Serratia fonticola TaxID=47917 RepID=A0A4U9T858_SERFO|nr:Vitamin B12 import ATP-binding protein BtuD [Serratia fonticola]
MPVFQYLALHQPAGAEESELEKAILYLARSLKLADKLSRMLTQLSGGEWQRVRLAAVLLQVWPTVNPLSQLLLLDEPTNSLDVAQKVALDSPAARILPKWPQRSGLCSRSQSYLATGRSGLVAASRAVGRRGGYPRGNGAGVIIQGFMTWIFICRRWENSAGL